MSSPGRRLAIAISSGSAAHEADRREIARHLDRQVGGGARRRHEGRERRDEQRVAIGRRAGRQPRRDRAAGARLVNRQRLLAPDLGEPVGDNAQDHVDRAAGRRVGDDLDRTGGEVLRACDDRGCEDDKTGGDKATGAHRVLPPCSFCFLTFAAGPFYSATVAVVTVPDQPANRRRFWPRVAPSRQTPLPRR
jgi:hypothetical protein